MENDPPTIKHRRVVTVAKEGKIKIKCIELRVCHTKMKCKWYIYIQCTLDVSRTKPQVNTIYTFFYFKKSFTTPSKYPGLNLDYLSITKTINIKSINYDYRLVINENH